MSSDPALPWNCSTEVHREGAQNHMTGVLMGWRHDAMLWPVGLLLQLA